MSELQVFTLALMILCGFLAIKCIGYWSKCDDLKGELEETRSASCDLIIDRDDWKKSLETTKKLLETTKTEWQQQALKDGSQIGAMAEAAAAHKYEVDSLRSNALNDAKKINRLASSLERAERELEQKEHHLAMTNAHVLSYQNAMAGVVAMLNQHLQSAGYSGSCGSMPHETLGETHIGLHAEPNCNCGPGEMCLGCKAGEEIDKEFNWLNNNASQESPLGEDDEDVPYHGKQ